MKILSLSLLIACASSSAAQTAELPAMSALPDSVIDAAIRVGVETKQGKVFATGAAGSGFGASLLRSAGGTYEIYLQGPAARIQTLAATNAKKYMPFTRDSVPPAARMPYFLVRVVPSAPKRSGASMRQSPQITHVVLQGRGKDSTGADLPILQPLLIEKEPVSWGNAFGATYSGEAYLVMFDMRQLPDHDLDVVVISAGPEFRVRVKRDEINSIR